MEKTAVYEQTAIDSTRKNTWRKINKLRKMSYFPVFGIALLHLIAIYFFWNPEIFKLYYLVVIYIAIGALIFIFLANVTQGSKVLPGRSSDSDSDFWI